MNLKNFSVAALLLLFALCAQIANAALKTNTQLKEAREANPEAAYNPHRHEGDISLPMPGNLQLVLRPVMVGVTKYLEDKPVQLGQTSASQDRAAVDSDLTGYVSGPFTLGDLPPDWQKAVKESDEKLEANGAGPFFYFLGKYELSNGQWDAVMGEESGLPPDEPKTNISWYDIQDFLHKYNEWLMENHPEKLPTIGGIPGFLRLPTEAEWVYAARGGNKDRSQVNEFGLPEGQNIRDYAVFNAPKLSNIGSKKANDLKIYDMNGNADELVQDGFHFITTDSGSGAEARRPRLHGSEGGFLKKGGSRESKSEDLLNPGRREEVRLITKTPSGKYEFSREPNLGARLAFSAYNMQSGKRIDNILKELKAGSQTTLVASGEGQTAKQPESTDLDIVAINIHGDPLVELAKLYQLAPSDSMKESLDQYKRLIEDFNQSYTREHDANLLNNIRSTVFLCDAINNIAFRCYEQERRAQIAEKLKTKDMTPEDIKRMRDNVRVYYGDLVITTNQYKNNVRALSRFPAKELKEKAAQLKQEYNGNDKFNENFRAMIDNFSRHIDLVKKQGNKGLDNDKLLKDILLGQNTYKFISGLAKNSKGQ